MKKSFQLKNLHIYKLVVLILSGLTGLSEYLPGQTGENILVTISPEETYQTVVGFGGSLAYYENWLTAHPKKNEIYDAIFSELSLDILRIRNSYDYDPGMIDRVKEFASAAETSLGKPIDILSTSWGPPAYLKSNNDRKNGGTLKYTAGENGIEFDYAGFAGWWYNSLDEYNANGIYPDYISIQNEPDFSASWESCLLRPVETVNTTDTIAGYNKALDAVYDTVMKRDIKPRFLGPETIGIGYNAVENYVNALDIPKLYGIAHHLYHGANEDNPFESTNWTKVGEFHPEIPHFQTEYSRGDWFPLAGLIYKSFHDENAVAYLHWDLIWADGGLVSLDNPWYPAQWPDPQKGYTRTKHYYVFKQFSRFIHPGWQRIGTTLSGDEAKGMTFLSAGKDSATFVVINRSEINTLSIHISIPGYRVDESSIYKTSATENCEFTGSLIDSTFMLTPMSIVTVEMSLSEIPVGVQPKKIELPGNAIVCNPNYPNPFAHSTTLSFTLKESERIWLTILDNSGREVNRHSLGLFPSGNQKFIFQPNGLSAGIYLYKLENSKGEFGPGRFTVQ